MEHSTHHDASQNPQSSAASQPDLRIGPEPRAAPQPPRLRKRRSNGGLRNQIQAQPLLSPGQNVPASRGSGSTGPGGFAGGAKARRGSIRNAVRKIFGRHSGAAISPDREAVGSSMRHGYHKSDSAALSPPSEMPEVFMPPEDIENERAAEPFASSFVNQPGLRTGSPYAVQFPNSVRLKPLDLGNPFIPAKPQLKRRKTLPSLLLEEREAIAALTAASLRKQSSDAARISTGAPVPNAPVIGKRTSSKVRKSRRTSRSLDDMKGKTPGESSPPRKRSEEIRHWRESFQRESFQPDVLRASGFTSRAPEEDTQLPQRGNEIHSEELGHGRMAYEDSHEDKTPMHAATDPAIFKSSPPTRIRRDMSLSENSYVAPPSGVGTDMSKDLEDRVAKLEAGLHNFQRSLQKMTADRNRRTIVMGSATTRRSSDEMRTPSLLADTLVDNLEHSPYQYEYEQTSLRPSASPQHVQQPQPQSQPPNYSRPQAPPMDDPFGPESSAQTRPREVVKMPSPLSFHPPNQQPPVPSSSVPRTQPQQYTFSSLYQMLADERSARRKLESQLKHLQREITDLHTQVSASSQYHSQRSSYMLAGSSIRLRELLRETEEGSSPPQSPEHQQQQQQRDSGHSSTAQRGNYISRFSGSDTEGGITTDVDEFETPYENYQTPKEQRSMFGLAGGVAAEDSEMF